MKKLIVLAVEFMLFIPMLHAQDTLRIMTYNISAGEMADMQQLGYYINSIHPDIVALQEVDYQTNRSYRPKDRGKNQPGELAYYTNMLPIFGKSIPMTDGGYYGIGCLSKHPITGVDIVRLPQKIEQEPRVMTIITCDVNGTPITVVSTHLGLNITNREIQMKYILKYLKKHKGIKIICGDFNSTPEEGLVQSIFTKWNDALPANTYTFPNTKATKKYDYMLYEQKYPDLIVNAQVDSTCQLSDHLPCYIDIVIPSSK